MLEESQIFGRTPSSSAITSDGTGKAKSRTMSAGGPLSIISSEVLVDQFLDLRPHCFATPEGEVGGHHAPQPVMLGIVDPRENHRRARQRSTARAGPEMVSADSRGSSSAALMSW